MAEFFLSVLHYFPHQSCLIRYKNSNQEIPRSGAYLRKLNGYLVAFLAARMCITIFTPS